MVDWLQVGQTSGSGDTQILVRAIPNNKGKRRSTLLVSGNIKSLEIPVIQASAEFSNLYFTLEARTNGTIEWLRYSQSTGRGTLYYDINYSGNWDVLSSVNVVEGDIVRIKGNRFRNNYTNRTIGHFGGTAYFDVYGNMASLANGDDFIDYTLTVFDTELCFLFSESNVVDASGLVINANEITSHGFQGMFEYCESLTSAPELPALRINENGYDSMFIGCSSLITAPKLPATYFAPGWDHYAYMFFLCSSLVNPPELPATSISSGCYEFMFYGCTSLKTAPALPAEELEPFCYQHMFYGCSSLTTAPELPATTLEGSCYQYMFYGCSSLTTVPELPATSLIEDCYAYMFAGCTSLVTAATLPNVGMKEKCCEGMFSGCTSITTIPRLPSLVASACFRYMFAGCTSLVTVPELPGGTSPNCYAYMFAGCTSLTTVPELPAKTLAVGCYDSMFSGCTSLNYIKCLATNISAQYCTRQWVEGVGNYGTFVKASSMVSWSTGTSGIPSGWTVEDA